MIEQEINIKTGIKVVILICTVLVCGFLIAYVYFSKSTVYYESSKGTLSNNESVPLLKKTSVVVPFTAPSFDSNATPIDSPFREDWITTNDAISFIQIDKKNILSVRSIAPFNSSGQSFGFEILTDENSFINQYVVTAMGITEKIITEVRSEKIKPFPVGVPDSSLAVKSISSNPYFTDKNLIGVAIYFDNKLKLWKYIIRTDAGDVSIPI